MNARLIVDRHYSAEIDTEILQLAGMARADLFFGPHSAADYAEEDPDAPAWPGFLRACRTIAEYMRDFSRVVWVSESTDCVLESEPEGWAECFECDGTGEIDGETCDCCDGSGMVEDGDSYQRVDVLEAVFGRELAEYLDGR